MAGGLNDRHAGFLDQQSVQQLDQVDESLGITFANVGNAPLHDASSRTSRETRTHPTMTVQSSVQLHHVSVRGSTVVGSEGKLFLNRTCAEVQGLNFAGGCEHGTLYRYLYPVKKCDRSSLQERDPALQCAQLRCHSRAHIWNPINSETTPGCAERRIRWEI